MSTFVRGITETVPSLFRGIFSERNSVPNPKSAQLAGGLMRSQITKDTIIERKIFADNSLGELTYRPPIAIKNIKEIFI